jgi:histidyl-tRNA synthetase
MQISSQPYKGTRDFYPKNSIINQVFDIDYMVYQRYILDTWRKTMISLGFDEYDASIIENAEIYLVKSGEELGSKQLYSFIDKGERKIALRPEMTPSLARMVAAKVQNLRYPLRWFSIPNCFRYEAPQKGRLREHWQLNIDILGLEAGYVELEILQAVKILYTNFGANSNNLTVEINSRSVMDQWLEKYKLNDFQTKIFSIIDNWKKVNSEIKRDQLSQFLTSDQIANIFNLCDKQEKEWEDYLELAKKSSDLQIIIQKLNILDTNFEINPVIIRGQAYYTGIVFEVFDKNTTNPRSLFGGGRYDNLMDLFSNNPLPAVGFGSGDVTWFEFLKNWNLLDGSDAFENWKKENIPEKVGILLLNESSINQIYDEVIPKLVLEKKVWDIDYDTTRSENKRYESLKKRGCNEIIKI